jgi:hypothetical protein
VLSLLVDDVEDRRIAFACTLPSLADEDYPTDWSCASTVGGEVEERIAPTPAMKSCV